jgi:ribonuclease T1
MSDWQSRLPSPWRFTLAIGVVIVVAVLLGRGGDTSPDPEADFDVVQLADLPAQVRDTVDLIESDGPFPYPQDGATFLNLERTLPDRVDGYYREYTVATPGSSDRGPRRLVLGKSGEMYYTDDHYASFVEVEIE